MTGQTGLEKNSQEYHTPHPKCTYNGVQEAHLQVIDSFDIQLSSRSPFVIENLLFLPFIIQVLASNHLLQNQQITFVWMIKTNWGTIKPVQKHKEELSPWRSGKGLRRRSFEGIQGFCVGAFRCKPEPASWHRERCMPPWDQNKLGFRTFRFMLEYVLLITWWIDHCTNLETWAAYVLWSFRIGLGADFWKISIAISRSSHTI